MANSKKMQDRALADFLNGMSMSEIAKKYDKTIRTVERWSQKNNWASERKKFNEKFKSTLYEKLSKRIEESSEKLLESVRILSHMGTEALIEQLKKKKHLEFIDIKEWAKILVMTSTIQKNVMPSAPEEISQKILAELESLGEAIRGNSEHDDEAK